MLAPLSYVDDRATAEIDAGPGTPKVKKIPSELRRRKTTFPPRMAWHRRFFWRLKNDSQFLRTSVQLAFVLLCLWIGVEFHLFVRWGQSEGLRPFVNRPPGVEGFLPIGALMSLKYLYQTGVLNPIHPSGLYILTAILVMSVFLKKAFCSWFCPVGTLSESLWMLGQRVIGKNLQIAKWLDYPLRSLKYLLLLFFVYAIGNMDVQLMGEFIEGPYNRMADVKMCTSSSPTFRPLLFGRSLFSWVSRSWCATSGAATSALTVLFSDS